jgi:HEAT repeat protein
MAMFLASTDSAPQDPTSVKLFQKLLNDQDVRLQLFAAAALSGTGSAGAAAMRVLSRALSGDDIHLKPLAAAALGRMDVRESEAVDCLILALHEEDRSAWLAIVGTLGQAEPAAIRAVPPLVALFTNRKADVNLRAAIAHTLGMISRGGDQAEAASLVALRSREWQVVW